MWKEILLQAWDALSRNRTRSLLTMLGIVWGIVSVTLLLAYGGGFRETLVEAFEAFGKSVVICWPGQTSHQAGGERAGKRIHFEKVDVESIRAEAPLVKDVCLETVRFIGVSYGDRVQSPAVRGVCPEYGALRNEVASEGRWITAEDEVERRRVAFLGGRLKQKLFSGRPAVGETVRIQGVRFTVIGVMDRKIQMSNYFSSDDDSVFIPFSAAGHLWDTRYASVLLFSPYHPRFEQAAMEQVRAAVAKRQRFSPTDERAIRMYGREQFRPVIDGITIGLQVLLAFIGALTLGIGGVGVMNIMLVSVNERTREIGVRRALGAKRGQIRTQILSETLVLTMGGGLAGIALAYLLASLTGSLPLLGSLFQDTSGKGDIHLVISPVTVLISTAILIFVGVFSGLMPAMRAARLDPADALRYE